MTSNGGGAEQTEEGFRVGDVVTRDGTDRHRVIAILAPDLIEVECISEPAPYAPDEPPWTRRGERETNLSRRYSYPDSLTIDGGAPGPHQTAPPASKPLRHKPET